MKRHNGFFYSFHVLCATFLTSWHPLIVYGSLILKKSPAQAVFSVFLVNYAVLKSENCNLSSLVCFNFFFKECLLNSNKTKQKRFHYPSSVLLAFQYNTIWRTTSVLNRFRVYRSHSIFSLVTVVSAQNKSWSIFSCIFIVYHVRNTYTECDFFKTE